MIFGKVCCMHNFVFVQAFVVWKCFMTNITRIRSFCSVNSYVCFTLLFTLNVWRQILQEYGFSPVWVIRWPWRHSFDVKFSWQILQENCLSRGCILCFTSISCVNTMQTGLTLDIFATIGLIQVRFSVLSLEWNKLSSLIILHLATFSWHFPFKLSTFCFGVTKCKGWNVSIIAF